MNTNALLEMLSDIVWVAFAYAVFCGALHLVLFVLTWNDKEQKSKGSGLWVFIACILYVIASQLPSLAN